MSSQSGGIFFTGQFVLLYYQRDKYNVVFIAGVLRLVVVVNTGWTVHIYVQEKHHGV